MSTFLSGLQRLGLCRISLFWPLTFFHKLRVLVVKKFMSVESDWKWSFDGSVASGQGTFLVADFDVWVFNNNQISILSYIDFLLTSAITPSRVRSKHLHLNPETAVLRPWNAFWTDGLHLLWQTFLAWSIEDVLMDVSVFPVPSKSYKIHSGTLKLLFTYYL